MRKLIDLIIQNSQDDLLQEAKAYDGMFDAVEALAAKFLNIADSRQDLMMRTNADKVRLMIESSIHFPKNYISGLAGGPRLERQDRIIFYLREVRLYAIGDIKHVARQQKDEDIENEAHVLEQKYLSQYSRQTGVSFQPIDRRTGWSIRFITGTILHFLGVPYSKLQNYRFDLFKTWEQTIKEMGEIEEEFKERAKNSVTLEQGDKILIRLPDNYEWVLLNRASCSKEAAAMGHCGNSPRSNTKDRILSLRQKAGILDGVEYWKPCLTFILEQDGHLSEMKGRGNAKPAAHYHDQIEALLRHDIIKGLRGGGYLAQNNFALKDFEDDRLKRIAVDKQELLSAEERYRVYGLTKSLADSLHDSFKTRTFINHNNDFKKLNMSEEDKDKLYKLFPDMLPPQKYYEQNRMDDVLMKRINKDLSSRPHNMYSNHGPCFDDWFNNESYDTFNFSSGDLEPEDRIKLFKAYPDFMKISDLYEVFGLNSPYMKLLAENVKEHGREWLNDNDIDPDEFTKEDRETLYNKHPMVAPALWQFKKFGQTKKFVDNACYAITNWGNNIYDTAIPVKIGKETFIKMYEFDNVSELFSHYGDSTAKNYSSDDDDFDYYSSDVDTSNFDDHLPLYDQIKLAEIAKGYLDKDDAEDFDPSNWNEIVEILENNDDENHNAIVRGMIAGYEGGASAELYKAKQKVLKNLNNELKYGKLIFSTYTNSRGEEYVDLHEKISFMLSCEDAAKLIDNEIYRNENDGTFEDFLNEPISLPNRDFDGFDEDWAVDTFHDNCTYDNPKNPHKDKKLSLKQMIKVMAELYETIPDGMAFKPDMAIFDQMSDEEVKKKFDSLVKNYYG